MSNDQVRINAEKDPAYAPYCLRCRTMERMKIVEPFLWSCACGTICDERSWPLPGEFKRAFAWGEQCEGYVKDAQRGGHLDRMPRTEKNAATLTWAYRRERENVEGLLRLVDETAAIFKVEAIGTLGQKITAIANQLQMRAEKMGWGREHFLDGSCWCDPIVEGNVVKHKGLDSDMPIVSQSAHSKEI